MSTSQQPASAHQPSACQRVLATTELLELVFRNLGLKDITRVQRVAQKWRALIQGSVHLRDGDFGTPRQPQELLTWVLERRRVSGSSRTQPVPQPRIVEYNSTRRESIKTPRLICRIHPRLNYIQDSVIPTPGLSFLVDWTEMATWSAGRWQDQLLTQPPCYALAYKASLTSYLPLIMKSRRSDPQRPLTLGDLCDILNEVYHNPDTELRIPFHNNNNNNKSNNKRTTDHRVLRFCVLGYLEENELSVTSAKKHQVHESQALERLARLTQVPADAPPAVEDDSIE